MGAYGKLNINKLRMNVEGRLDEDIAKNNVGFADITVMQNGETVLHISKGGNNECCPAKSDKPHLFRLASMTKPTTVVAFLQQYEKGKIDLYAPLSDYLPEYKTMTVGHNENGKLVIDKLAENEIKVFHLMCHTSGIDNGGVYDAAIKLHPRKTLRETVEFYSKIPLAYEPFSQNGYSESAGFDIAARLVETVSGESFGDYVKNHIFAPLGMNDTGYVPTPEQNERIIPMHSKNENGESVIGKTVEGCVFEDMPYSCTLAGAGLFSSAEDYLRFAEMLRRGGLGENGERILTDASVKIMSTAHVPACIMAGTDRWGLGVRVVCEEESHLPVGTFGWSGAYGSHFWIDKVNNITALYMRNSLFDSCGCGNTGWQFEKDVMNSFDI